MVDKIQQKKKLFSVQDQLTIDKQKTHSTQHVSSNNLFSVTSSVFIFSMPILRCPPGTNGQRLTTNSYLCCVFAIAVCLFDAKYL